MGLFSSKIYDLISSVDNLHNKKRIKISSENFGYIFLGHLLFEYLEWLNFTVKTNKINNIFFCSREGFFLKKIYQKFFQDNKVNLVYFKTSRFLSYNISFFKTEDIIDSFKFHRFSGTFKDLLLNRFGIKIDKKNKNCYEIINSNNNIKKIKILLKPFINLILENSKKLRFSYRIYINKITKKNKIAISDISLFSTVQRSLQKINNLKYFGIYIPTQTNYKERYNMKFMKISKNFEKKYFILESILTAPHGSYLYLDNNLKFKLSPKKKNQKKFLVRNFIIDGVIKYFKDIIYLKKLYNLYPYNKKSYSFGVSKDYLFDQLDNNIFLFDKRMLNSLYFDNLLVRSDENKIIF